MPTMDFWDPVSSTVVDTLANPSWIITCPYLWILGQVSRVHTYLLLYATPRVFITGISLTGDLLPLLAIFLDFTTTTFNILNCLRYWNDKRNRAQTIRKKKQKQGDICQTSDNNYGKIMSRKISKRFGSGLTRRPAEGSEHAINTKKCMEKSADHFGP